MPANRSRTDNWRRSLRNIQERNGALEISLPRFFAGGNPDGADEETGSNLIWRVRIIELSDEEIIVEQPSALGQTIPIEDKVELIGVIAVGQNRWMFKTVNLGRCKVQLNAQRETVCLRLRMPVHVERCQRRAFYRIATVGLVLPEVRVWPVLDPLTIPAAEAASRARVQMHEDGQVIGAIGQANSLALPEVGPSFQGTLSNVGGGGAGLVIQPDTASAVDSHRLFWLSISLQGDSVPIGVAARLVHTHRDSEQRLHAGLAFEFPHGSQHKKFVIDRIVRYVTELQREQLKRLAEIRPTG